MVIAKVCLCGTSVAAPNTASFNVERYSFTAACRRRIDLLLPLDAWDRTLAVGVSFDQARIDGEAFAANRPALYAGLQDALERRAGGYQLSRNHS